MKDKISVPGPAKAMYGTYIGALILVLYTGFNLLSPFLSGWRYPWSNELAAIFNFYMCWILVLTAIVYLYYSTLGRPEGWNEPLGAFRIFLVLLTVWFGLLTVKQVLELLDQRPQSVEIILTGRYAPQEFIEYADLVSEMKEVKHYYKNQGILARDGIER